MWKLRLFKAERFGCVFAHLSQVAPGGRRLGIETYRWGTRRGVVTKEHREFASMDRTKQREIASKGGKAAHQKGVAH